MTSLDKEIDHSRHFVNPNLIKVHDSVVAPCSLQSWKAQTYLEMIQQIATRCRDAHPSNSPSSLGSLYCGGLGPLVYLDWKLAMAMRQVEKNSLSSNNSPSQALLSQVLLLAQQAAKYHEKRSSRSNRVTLLESPFVGAKAMEAVILHSLGHAEAAQNSAQQLLEWLRSKTTNSPNGTGLTSEECEVLYGRAGAIQAILFLRKELINPLLGSSLVMELSEAIVQQGQKLGRQYSSFGFPLLWQWHDSFYLGAAHGVVGILHTLLSLNSAELEELDQRHSIRSLIRQTIYCLNAKYCFSSGNLHSSIPDTPRRQQSTDRLVQWCHGAPGHVLLLLQASHVFQCSDYKVQATRIADQVIWSRGLLNKGVGLCHGISGNAYAFLALAVTPTDVANSDDDNDQNQRANFLAKARFFADFALNHLANLQSIPDRPYSLYEGMGGLALLLIDLMDSDPATHAINFPLYAFS